MADGINGPGGGFAQEMFELGEEFFDRIEVGRVFREQDQPGADAPYGLSDGFPLMGAKIVHDHDVTRAQCRDELRLDIGAEAFAVDQPL